MDNHSLLQKLRIVNFKAFADHTLSLRPLTLLTGLNGMGKSTVLQTLLLLRQTYLQGLLNDGLLLNGELAQVGFAPEAKYEGAGIEDDILFALTFDDGSLMQWQYNYQNITSITNSPRTASGQQRIEQIDLIPLVARKNTTGKKVDDTPLFSNEFNFLHAERIGPRNSFSLSDIAARRRQVGPHGEYAFHFLSRYSRESVLAALHHPATSELLAEYEPDSLIVQVNAWLQEISPGTRLVLEPYPEMGVMRVGYQIERGRSLSREYRSANYGFGVTYSLPLLIAILSAKPGALILLENPEAHLHPRGQSCMGELMARAASAGIQLIVETHSDHIVNAIRVAIHGDEDILDGFSLSSDSAVFHFFQRKRDGEIDIISPEVDTNGRFTHITPIDFFDEHRRNLGKLL